MDNPRWRLHLLTIAWFLTALLVACGSTSSQVTEADYRIRQIAITSSDELIARGSETNRDQRGRAAVGSTVAGATAGGAIGAAGACGPWFPVCVLMTTTIGAITGLAAGGVASGTVYGFEGLSSTDELYFREALTDLATLSDFQQDLFSLVAEQMPRQLLVRPEDADAQVVSHLERISFVEVDSAEVQLVVRGTLTVVSVSTEQGPPIFREFDSASDVAAIDVWLATDANKIAEAMDVILADLARQMSTALLKIVRELETQR